MFKNFKNIEHMVFGRGSFEMLPEILTPLRKKHDGFILFVVDDYFRHHKIGNGIPAEGKDQVSFIAVDLHEPTTQQIDELRDATLAEKGLPAAVVGIGGGSILDIAKAVSLMFTNPGSSTLYQGLNLIKQPGVYHIGIPTISGTGAEVSMTAVLMGPEKKLGLKCDWTTFNQLILDPAVIDSVPKDKWFYTGMDTYIHCIESLSGIMNNAFSTAYAEQALTLCREIYLGDGQTPVNNEKLMIASLMGGLSLTYSEVGICHALSYGLSKVFGTRHCYANCIIFQHLGDLYQEGHSEFMNMLSKQQIVLPQNLRNEWPEEKISEMAGVAYKLTHMWRHAMGEDWETKISMDFIRSLYLRM